MNSLVLRFHLIVLYILFLRTNFTSNTRWESRTFHHDENSLGLNLGGFSKSFWLESVKFSRLFKQNYTTLNYTLYYTALCSNMTSRKKKGRYHRKWGDVLKVFSGRYSRCINVTRLKKIIVNILYKNGTQTIMFVQLRYDINYFNSRELSFWDQTLP